VRCRATCSSAITGAVQHAGEYAKLASGGANPYIDPESCKVEAEISELMVRAILAEQGARSIEALD